MRSEDPVHKTLKRSRGPIKTERMGKELFQSCLGHHSGTGYSSNHHPVLYYSSSLDRCDNPQIMTQIVLSLMDSFESQFKCHYQRLVLPNGTESLACFGSRNGESGYLQLDTQPRPVRAKHAHIQRHRRLQDIVPCHFTLVLREQFPVKLIGPREESGYTKRTSLQPNTFLPQHINVDSCKTLKSVMRTDFLPGSFLQGNEALPKHASQALRETGFTRDTQKPLASSASLQSNLNEDSRLKNRPAIASWSVQPVCSSGFVLNAPNITRLSHTPADPQHFLTHYQSFVSIRKQNG
ncbi:protein phosphatase 1 regulatory subunit 32-like [Myxocyprinus asiaticus]|uniref:protein phosphatase 1 regulatory subunit 32-like n=1 Tax=Myxocyprinus asiaticus TaxID=70543 RepID=UPI002221B857|nr:protein phosphatase 1 regulatory subunit 32-like [Myxocyprinus asiaticus]